MTAQGPCKICGELTGVYLFDAPHASTGDGWYCTGHFPSGVDPVAAAKEMEVRRPLNRKERREFERKTGPKRAKW